MNQIFRHKNTYTLILTLAMAMDAMVIPTATAEGDEDNTTATVTFATNPSDPGGAMLYLDHVPTFNFDSHTIAQNQKTWIRISALCP